MVWINYAPVSKGFSETGSIIKGEYGKNAILGFNWIRSMRLGCF
jgi:hypothetical protein